MIFNKVAGQENILAAITATDHTLNRVVLLDSELPGASEPSSSRMLNRTEQNKKKRVGLTPLRSLPETRELLDSRRRECLHLLSQL
jgi:hypothetical protein